MAAARRRGIDCLRLAVSIQSEARRPARWRARGSTRVVLGARRSQRSHCQRAALPAARLLPSAMARAAIASGRCRHACRAVRLAAVARDRSGAGVHLQPRSEPHGPDAQCTRHARRRHGRGRLESHRRAHASAESRGKAASRPFGGIALCAVADVASCALRAALRSRKTEVGPGTADSSAYRSVGDARISHLLARDRTGALHVGQPHPYARSPAGDDGRRTGRAIGGR